MLSKYIQYFLEENDLTPNEAFSVVNENGEDLYDGKTFYINENATNVYEILKCWDNDKDCFFLTHLLAGFCFPKKKPYWPKPGQEYFYIDINTNSCDSLINKAIFNEHYLMDIFLRKYGKCYRTYNEAEKHLEKDYKDLIGEEE